MGSLGAPGCGFGLAPAFSFNGDIEDAILNAYVTPLASGAEMAEFIRSVDEDLPVPSILTDGPDQRYLFGGVAEDEADIADKSILRAFCSTWG